MRKSRALASGMPLALAGRGIVTEAEYAKTKAYSAEKNNFGFVNDTYGTVQSLAFVLWLDPILWDLAVSYSPWPETQYSAILTFLVLNTAISTALGLPPSVWFNFVLEERHAQHPLRITNNGRCTPL